MKKIEIILTDEQYKKLTSEIRKGNTLNLKEETFSGFNINLNCVEGGFSWLEFNMHSTIDLGDVEWSFK